MRLALLLLAVSSLAQAQQPRLGTIDFPVAMTGPAREHFLSGVLYLHSFEYDAAAADFRRAQQASPGFAMAYWGEAMTYNHPIWDQQNREAALAALGRLAPDPEARRALATTEKERAWLAAIETLYGEGPKPRRDTLYAAAMGKMAAEWPDDLEVQTFYALSLMGLSQSTRVVPTYMRAGAIALAAFEKNRDHPGAAHYAIHAFDDPIHAPLGMRAAEAYSEIAPGAAHAQHMTTHIFLAVGEWDRVVSQNVIASGQDTAKWLPGHYTSWLGYGLLQQGRFKAAREHLDLVARNMEGMSAPGRRGTLMLMRAYHLVNAEPWSDTTLFAPIDARGVGPVPRAADAFAVAFARIRRGEVALARTHLEQAAGDPVLKAELEGLLALAAGDTVGALERLRHATRIEDTLPMAFGPPDIVKPSHELLGETLLLLGRPSEARVAFERALELAPGRLRALLGLHAAAQAEGNALVAQRARSELAPVMKVADAAPALDSIRRSNGPAGGPGH